jgi:hypothetical protein
MAPAPEWFRRKPHGRGFSGAHCSAQRLPYNSSAMTEKVICVVRAPVNFVVTLSDCSFLFPSLHFQLFGSLEACLCLVAHLLSTLCILVPLFQACHKSPDTHTTRIPPPRASKTAVLRLIHNYNVREEYSRARRQEACLGGHQFDWYGQLLREMPLQQLTSVNSWWRSRYDGGIDMPSFGYVNRLKPKFSQKD